MMTGARIESSLAIQRRITIRRNPLKGVCTQIWFEDRKDQPLSRLVLAGTIGRPLGPSAELRGHDWRHRGNNGCAQARQRRG